ncbi:MAG: 16S rRNA (uracil(1498)-N(3))-methyltransferase [Deltaproteobacteria bacterium]|nr:MAG: 16S rRNA (uracil(1498)-N(3))-methyltransferase [Deltaproteobacteria bacterium]
MNLLLVDPAVDEVGPGRATITGERVRHVRKVLRKREGDILRVGVLGGRMGTGRITALSPTRLTVAWDALDVPPPAKRPLTLMFALCRPPMMQRILQAAASFGVAEILWFPAARTEASFLDSHVLRADGIRRALRLGLAQGRDTLLPRSEGLATFDEAVRRVETAPGRKLLARAGAPACPCGATDPTCVIVGPEGGLLPDEEARFLAAGARAVGLGPWTLRTEVAVAALLGRFV